ncbi:hypothetical protein [uncultured Hoeflea sp.]|uniref:hypothetical protein n=1 Tax=uncultured Hoeflea sp. TaxID=538666 RepID=UPI0030D93D4D|tara:strand:+ start:7419 stop:8552 length:1134 start_codon:yes stop_codon:yes gene_type:complete
MLRKLQIGLVFGVSLLSACATPERVNNPRVFDDTTGRLTAFLAAQGFTFDYSLLNNRSMFPSSAHAGRSLEKWHELLDENRLTPPGREPRPNSPKRYVFKHNIAAEEYQSAVDSLAWEVFSQDRLHKLKLIELRNTITIERVLSLATMQADRILAIMNRNSGFFSSSDFSVVKGSISRFSSARDESRARSRELESAICSSAVSCNRSVLSHAARSFSRVLQHSMFLIDYTDDRYASYISHSAKALNEARDYELYYFSLNSNAERDRIFKLEKSLASYEEMATAQSDFRSRYIAQLRQGGHATFNGYHTSLDRMLVLIGELESEVSGLETGTSELNVSLRLINQVEEEVLSTEVNFDRFASIIISGYVRKTEDYPWPD